jgi:nucleotide-binding universal stress UspA family protein
MKVLLAVDDDERLESVLDFVERRLALTAGRGGEVLVAHVVATLRFMLPPPSVFERVDDFLEETAGRVRSRGIDATPLRLEGDVGSEILKASREHGCDLVVLGAYGQARTQDFLVGSVAEKVETLADRDVLLVRDSKPGSALRALLAVDGSEDSLDAVRAFARYLRTHGATARVVTVLDVPPGISVPPAIRERADEALRRAVDELASEGLRAESVVRHGTAAADILDEAATFEANLIVAGARGLGPLLSFALRSGTVARRLSRHAPCSVLVGASRRREE